MIYVGTLKHVTPDENLCKYIFSKKRCQQQELRRRLKSILLFNERGIMRGNCRSPKKQIYNCRPTHLALMLPYDCSKEWEREKE